MKHIEMLWIAGAMIIISSAIALGFKPFVGWLMIRGMDKKGDGVEYVLLYFALILILVGLPCLFLL